MLKLHSGQSGSQQTVLTIPANQLKQLSISGASTGLQTILMPVGKGDANFLTLCSVCVVNNHVIFAHKKKTEWMHLNTKQLKISSAKQIKKI